MNKITIYNVCGDCENIFTGTVFCKIESQRCETHDVLCDEECRQRHPRCEHTICTACAYKMHKEFLTSEIAGFEHQAVMSNSLNEKARNQIFDRISKRVYGDKKNQQEEE